MAQTVDLLVKVQDAEAKVKLDKITNDIRKAQQLAQEGITITSSSVKEDANGLVTAITKYIDAEKRLITLKQQEYVVQEEIRDEEGKITQERQTAIRDTKTISTNYAQITKELSRMEAESAKITAETERLAQNAERAKAAFAKSLTGKTRENYQNGGYSAEFASEVQSATTVAWQQYSASLTEAYQKQSQLNAETSMFGQISDSAFAQYSSGAMSAAVAQKDVNTAQEQSVESIAHGIVTAQKFFDTMNGVGRQCGVTADEVSVFAELSDDAFHKYAGGLMSASDANKTLKNSTKEVTEETKKSRGEFTLLNTVLIRLAHTVLSAVTRAFREALAEMKNVDSALVVVRKVSDASSAELLALKERAYEVGAAYGVLASDYLNAAAEMTRAGYRDQAGDLAELATKLQLVGDVSQDVANQFLIATDKSYKMNGNYQKLSETIDKLNEIDNNFATSFEKVADGIGLLAPVAAQANVSFDEMAAAIGTVTAVTQRSGTEAARALRSLFINILKDTTTEIEDGVTWTVDEINSLSDALKKYAPEAVKAAEATGDIINPMEALAALAQSYKDGLLTNQDLFEITSGLGGKLRTSQLLALIQNWDMYNQMLDKTAEAAGSADKEVQNALDSWEVKLNQLKNTFTEFVQKSLSTDFIKGLLDAVKWLIEGFGDLGTAVAIFGGSLIALKIPAFAASISKLVGNIGLFIMRVYSGVGANEAFAASFNGLSLTATVAKGAIGLIAIAISAAVIAINKYKQKLDETIERGKKAYDELKSLDDLQDKYSSLQQQYKDGTISEEEYAKGKDEVIKKLDEEGVWVDAVTGKYETLEEKIQGAIDASKEYKRIEIQDAIRALEEKSKNAWQGGFPLSQSPYAYTAASYLGIDTGTDPNQRYAQHISLETLVQLYDAAIERRDWLFNNGGYGSEEDVALQRYIESAKEIVEEYKIQKDILEELDGKATDSGEGIITVSDETAKSVKGLSDELKNATDALDKYKKALEGGEKGDALKSYSEAYKKAVELAQKGLTGTNQYMSAIDLIFGDVDDYEKAAELLDNGFIKSMFEGGGDDFGAAAANWIKKHIDELNGVALREADDGTFGLDFFDVDAFAEQMQISSDAVWILIDALDALNSKKTYTRDQLFNFMGLEDDGIEKFVNLTAMINDLAVQGKSAREIKGIVDAIKELAETDGNITISEPEDLDQTINDIVELNKEAEKDKDMEVVLTSNSDEFFDGIRKEIDQINGTTIYIGIRTKNSRLGLNEGLGSEASGTRSARGGLSLVNEEGAELIYANGKAWIAGGGDPTITNLPAGAGVFNAKETREILARSGIESHVGDGAYVSGIPVDTNNTQSNNNPSKSGGGKKSNLEKILEELAAYIEKILKKAKKALDAQLAAIDEQINALKREHDAAEDKNKLEELQLKILEAEKNLAEAKNERTVRYFNKETGQWEWMADQKAVHEAEKALQEAKDAYDKEVAEQAYQAQIQALEDLKQALQDQYNDLADHWQEIYDALKESEEGDVNYKKLLKKLGLDKDTSSDIKKLIKAILSYEKKMESGSYDVPLNNYDTAQILGYQTRGGSVANTIGQIFGISSSDLNAKGSSMFSTNSSNVIGDTIYYINGLKIGSDMMNKPLSEILSVLSIYAN